MVLREIIEREKAIKQVRVRLLFLGKIYVNSAGEDKTTTLSS